MKFFNLKKSVPVTEEEFVDLLPEILKAYEEKLFESFRKNKIYIGDTMSVKYDVTIRF